MQEYVAVEVDVGVSDPVGQWSLDPPEEGVQALHFVPRVPGVTDNFIF